MDLSPVQIISLDSIRYCWKNNIDVIKQGTFCETLWPELSFVKFERARLNALNGRTNEALKFRVIRGAKKYDCC